MMRCMSLPALLVLLAGPAVAQQPGAPPVAEPAPTEPQATGGTELIVVFIDTTGRAGADEPVFTVGTGEQALQVALRDDGEDLDVEAGDGRYVGLVSLPSTTPRPARLGLSDGEVIWVEADLAVPPGLPRPTLRLETGPGGLAADFSGNDRALSVPVDEDSDEEARAVSVLGVLGSPVLTGLLVGGGLALALRRRRREEPALLGPRSAWLAGLPQPEPGTGLRLDFPDPATRRAALVALADRLARDRQVVILPRADSRVALAEALADRPAALVPARDRVGVVGLITSLSAIDGGVVLVEGLDALEAPGPKEAADDPLDELIELSPLPVFVLTVSGEACRLPAHAAVAGLLERG